MPCPYGRKYDAAVGGVIMIGPRRGRSSAAGGDAVLNVEDEEFGEEVVDAVETVEFGSVFEEIESEIGKSESFRKGSVAVACF